MVILLALMTGFVIVALVIGAGYAHREWRKRKAQASVVALHEEFHEIMAKQTWEDPSWFS
jgi:hypothetical protein